MTSLSPSTAPSPTRDRILLQATRLFAERGWSATSVREVAEAAGCTKPALYYHFGNKEALFVAAIRHETDALGRILEMAEQATAGVSAYDRLRDGLRAFFARLESAPTGMSLLMRAELRPEPDQPQFDFDSLRTHHQERMRSLLQLGVSRGEISSSVDLVDAAYALSGMVDQRLQLWLHGHRPPADLPERLLSLFFHGVSPR